MAKVETPAADKVTKPYATFPLFPHATGRWAKKIRGRLHYFGKVSDGWEPALKRYEEQAAALHAGRTPKAKAEELTVRDLLNEYVNSLRRKMETGQISVRSYYDYKRAADDVVNFFGRQRLVTDLTTEDFGKFRADLSKRLGPVSLSSAVKRTRMILNWGHKAGLLEHPVKFGDEFVRPSQRELRLHRASRPPRVFTAQEIRQLLGAANTTLRAAILLAINGGIGASDISAIREQDINWQTGWLDKPRGKTGVNRRLPLWVETREALQQVLAERRTPTGKANRDLIFVTRYGNTYSRGVRHDTLGEEFRKIQDKLGIHRQGVSFYGLRHTFKTVAKALTRDTEIVEDIMAHADSEGDTEHNYDHAEALLDLKPANDDRRQKAVDAVHQWLFGSKNGEGTKSA